MPPSEASHLDARVLRVTVLSVWSNVGFFALKLLVGWFSGSLALVADGIHSLSDVATDGAVLLGHWLGTKAPDPKHPYGHGRRETFAAVFVGLALITVGAGMIYGAALALASGRVVRPRVAVLVIALISVVGKEVLYRLTLRVARTTRSSSLYANAWHHRSDALSSVAVVVGYVALCLGFVYGDHLAALAVGLLVIAAGAHVLGQCLDELNESAVDEDTMTLVAGIIQADPAIHDWHKLRSRSLGREIFLDLHILVDPSLDVVRAHDIADNLEKQIHNHLTCPVHITIHVEPDLPELRR